MPFQGGGGAAGANTALSNLASVAINASLLFDTDSAYDIGDSNKFVANAYIDKIYIGDVDNLRVHISSTGYANLEFSTLYGAIVRLISTDLFLGKDGNYNTLFFSHTVRPDTDSTHKFGIGSRYWKEGYFDKLFLNATATLDGATAGIINAVGTIVNANMPTSDPSIAGALWNNSGVVNISAG